MKFTPLLLLLLISCTASAPFKESEGKLEQENVREVILERWGRTPNGKQVRMHQTKTLTDPERIVQLTTEMNNAPYIGPWESNVWDKMLFVSPANDTTTFFTNGKIFGRSRTGSFYEFSTRDIYKTYWDINPDF